MPTPAFTWQTYEVRVPRDGPLVPLAAETLAPEALLPTAEPEVTIKLPLPILTAWPTPLEKAKLLLETAAEIEHMLLVQYLYSAYSLKDPGEVTDPAQSAALFAWPDVLLGIAREEMGHLLSVQNLLMLLGLLPNLEREDFPPRKELYPFKLHLEPLTQRSLAKYVVAEAPSDAAGIDPIIALAKETEGVPINHVGILYGLLGLVFGTEEQAQSGGAGSQAWDDFVRVVAQAAHQQAPPSAWHLPETAFHPETVPFQANPEDWQTGGGLRVHRLSNRQGARGAIRDIGEQGEGPTSDGAQSHFERFKSVYEGSSELPAFPNSGEWLPTRPVPTDPKAADFVDPRIRRWAELVDLRYALLLGFIEHYLLTLGSDRSLFTAWIYAEMRSRVGPVARRLTAMPLGAGAGVAAIPFAQPETLHLPASEPARWTLHQERTQAAIRKIEEMQTANAADAADPYLRDLLGSDRDRLALIDGKIAGDTTRVSFRRDILPLFRPKDIEHMRTHLGDRSFDLSIYAVVKEKASSILARLERTDDFRMPPPPDQPWTVAQTDLFKRWITDGFPE